MAAKVEAEFRDVMGTFFLYDNLIESRIVRSMVIEQVPVEAHAASPDAPLPTLPSALHPHLVLALREQMAHHLLSFFDQWVRAYLVHYPTPLPCAVCQTPLLNLDGNSVALRMVHIEPGVEAPSTSHIFMLVAVTQCETPLCRQGACKRASITRSWIRDDMNPEQGHLAELVARSDLTTTKMDWCDHQGCRQLITPPVHVCSRCKIQRYCSRDCQRADWNAAHRRVCREVELLTDEGVPVREAGELPPQEQQQQ